MTVSERAAEAARLRAEAFAIFKTIGPMYDERPVPWRAIINKQNECDGLWERAHELEDVS